MILVLDASALVELLLHTATGELIARRISVPATELHAPHLVDIEVAQALRRYVRAGDFDAAIGTLALVDLHDLDLQRHSHQKLLDRVWELRENVTAYDAVYVALAETLGAVLLTCDARLSRAPNLAGTVELIQAEGT